MIQRLKHLQCDCLFRLCGALQPTVKLLIDGEFRESEATEWVDVTNPVSSPF